MALAYAMARLDRIGRELNTTQEERDNPLEQISAEISNNFKTLHEIILEKEKIKKMILDSTSSEEKLAEAVKKSNNIILNETVQVSDIMIANVITEELKGPEQNILIHMGEGHLRSLIRSGPVAEYTAKLLEKVKTDPAFVRKALDTSKEKTKSQGP